MRFEELFYNYLILLHILFVINSRFNECVAVSHTVLFKFFYARQLTEIKHKIVSCFETGKFRLFMGCHWMEMG